MKNYGTKEEKSKTFTGWLRVQTSFDWHHFHFGIIILLFTIISIFFFNFIRINLILLAIGISMVIDQAVPIVDRKSNYFHLKNLSISFLFHVVVTIISIILRII